jgi:O-antigen ligase
MSLSFTRRTSNYLTDTSEGEKYFPLLVLTVIFGVMLFLPSNVIDLRMQKSLFPMMAIYLFVCGVIYVKANRPIAILGVFALFYSIYMFTPDSYTFLLVSIFYLTFYLLVVVFYGTFISRYKNAVYNFLCVFALINVAWLTMQHYKIFLLFYPIGSSNILETGWFGNRNEISVFLAICTPLFFRKGWVWGLVPMVFGFILSNTTNGVMVASIVSCIYATHFLFKRYEKRRTVIALLCIVFFASIIAGYVRFVHLGGYGQRMEANLAALEIIKAKPLLGWGIGQSYYVVPLFLNGEKLDPELVRMSVNSIYYQSAFVDLYTKKHNFKNNISSYWPQLHNDYLQWAVDTGAVGSVLVLLIILSHFLSALKSRQFEIIPVLVVAAALISANAFFTLQMGCFLLITTLFMGIIQGEYVSKGSA